MGPIRILIPIIFFIIFFIWILFRAFVKRDLKKHLNSMVVGFIFIAIWAGIYFWLK